MGYLTVTGKGADFIMLRAIIYAPFSAYAVLL